jgi:hypothetical protein
MKIKHSILEKLGASGLAWPIVVKASAAPAAAPAAYAAGIGAAGFAEPFAWPFVVGGLALLVLCIGVLVLLAWRDRRGESRRRARQAAAARTASGISLLAGGAAAR